MAVVRILFSTHCSIPDIRSCLSNTGCGHWNMIGVRCVVKNPGNLRNSEGKVRIIGIDGISQRINTDQ
jgi:hypothetical protein